jgi:1-pyrroline-5-carboxylate dehydrogenase
LYIGDNEIYTGEEFEKRSPINTDILMGYFQKANRENIKEAIATAKKAFKEWSSMYYTERIKIFRKVADIIEKKRFEIAAYITYEAGKNRMEALAEVHEAIDARRDSLCCCKALWSMGCHFSFQLSFHVSKRNVFGCITYRKHCCI